MPSLTFKVHFKCMKLGEKAIDVIAVLNFKAGRAELSSSEAILFSEKARQCEQKE